MTQKLAVRARGRWVGILTALGMPASFLTRKNGPCPFCGGKDRWRFMDTDGSGSWICNNCGHGSGTDLVMLFLKVDFREAAKRIEEHIETAPVRERPKADPRRQKSEMAQVWQSSRPITADSPPGRYLASRRLPFNASPFLRWGSGVPYAMMAGKVISPDHRAVNVHRTLLDANGKKAPVEKPKLLMGGETPNGSAIRLQPPKNGQLGVAEGIETALSAAILFNVPCWATIHSSGLAAFTPPDGVSELFIFGDNDLKFGGQAAAYALAKRMATRPKDQPAIAVTVSIPEEAGTDWNDYLMNMAEADYQALMVRQTAAA